MIPQLFCRHKYPAKSIRKVEKEIRKCAQPNIPNPVPGQLFYARNVHVEFYTVTQITEVFCCEKCGHFKTIVY